MKFRGELELNGKTATGITVPDKIIEELGAGRRPRVSVSFNSYTFQIGLGTMAGQVKIPVSGAIREAAGVRAGDQLEVQIELATQPVVVGVPDELRDALAGEPEAKTFFEGLTTSQQRGYTEWIEQAKKPETRQRRVDQALQALQRRQVRH
ncbi:MAG TPA: YdeI/OmpD-associated family protein [Microlunatus sp.]